MPSAVSDLPVTTGRMGRDKKRKPEADRHKTDRVNVGVPEPWHEVMRRLAANHKQPVLYLLIDLVNEQAQKEGFTDLPPLPWKPDKPKSDDRPP
ncbi:MAG TPA: hypothetical protein VKE74_14350 [Gemmataceae bacterium]|nr:hypothetical protein [Gemmataceae bacterium]